MSNLKPQTEKQKAHRVFKFYKATGKFPSDVSTLEAYNLLVKYNYFITKNIDKQVLNSLTELSNLIESNKVLIVYGDFELKTLYFGLENFLNTENHNIKINYIDVMDEKNIKKFFKNSIAIKSLDKSYIVYIIDNIDKIDNDSIDYLLELKAKLVCYKKAIICCTSNLPKVNKKLLSLRKIKLGDNEKDSNHYQIGIYVLFNMVDRQKAISKMKELDINLHYFLKLAIYNSPFFYDNNELVNVIEAINRCIKYVYKSNEEFIYSMLIYAIKPTKIRRAIKFIPKEVLNIDKPKKPKKESEDDEKEQK